MIGPGESIAYDPTLTEKLDCETELAIVIGKSAGTSDFRDFGLPLDHEVRQGARGKTT